jgi:hypothetical protein
MPNTSDTPMTNSVAREDGGLQIVDAEDCRQIERRRNMVVADLVGAKFRIRMLEKKLREVEDSGEGDRRSTV